MKCLDRHRKIQRQQGAEYRAEVPLKYQIACDGFILSVEGRADGIIELPKRVVIDEIKGVFKDLKRLKEPQLLHLAQAKCYAYIYAEQKNLEEIGVQMTYCNLDTEEIRRFQEVYTRAELKKWFEELVSEYEKLTSDTKVYVMMLIAPKDEGKTKSSAMLLYLFNDTRLRIDPRFSHYRFEIISDKESLHQKMDDKDAVLVLVDDYIGTGDTAVACIEQLDKLGIKMEQIAILSLVAQEEGKKKIEEKGIFFCTSNLRNKGISDYYEGKELEKNVRLMQKIEKDLKVGEKSRFGYGQSEALVTMCRTPNNTFPVFWYEPKLGIKKKLAPFPRF